MGWTPRQAHETGVDSFDVSRYSLDTLRCSAEDLLRDKRCEQDGSMFRRIYSGISIGDRFVQLEVVGGCRKCKHQVEFLDEL